MQVVLHSRRLSYDVISPRFDGLDDALSLSGFYFIGYNISNSNWVGELKFLHAEFAQYPAFYIAIVFGFDRIPTFGGLCDDTSQNVCVGVEAA